MGTPYLEQINYITGYDNIGTVDEPNSADWDGSGGSTQKLHLRFQVAETAGAKLNKVTFAVFCNTTNDPSTAFQVTTNGSANMEPVEIADSTDISDSTVISSGLTELSGTAQGTWLNGYFIDASDSFPTISFVGGDYTEFQACVQFTGYASYGTTYYFWIKQSDGTALDNYAYVGEVPVEHPYSSTFSTTWEILDSYTSNVSVAWGIKNQNTEQNAWAILTKKSEISEWGIASLLSQSVSWGINKKSSSDTTWEIFDFVYDVEWRKQGDTLLTGSASDITDLYYIVSELEAGTAYEWRVRAVEPATDTYPRYASEWSAWVQFTTTGSETLFLKQDISWRIKDSLYKNIEWKLKNALSENSTWAIHNTKTVSTEWNIAFEPVRSFFLVSTNLGGNMRLQLNVGMGIEKPFLLSSRLSEGYYKHHKLKTSISGEPVSRNQLQIQSLAEKNDIRVRINLLTSLSDPVSHLYSIPVEVKIE